MLSFEDINPITNMSGLPMISSVLKSLVPYFQRFGQTKILLDSKLARHSDRMMTEQFIPLIQILGTHTEDEIVILFKDKKSLETLTLTNIIYSAVGSNCSENHKTIAIQPLDSSFGKKDVEDFMNKYPQYIRNTAVETFLGKEQATKVMVFGSETKVIIFVNNTTLRYLPMYGNILLAIPAMFKLTELSKIELDILTAYSVALKSNAEEDRVAVDKLVLLNLKPELDKLIRLRLNTVKNETLHDLFYSRRLKDAQQYLNDTRRKIDDYERALRDQYLKLKEYQLNIAGIYSLEPEKDGVSVEPFLRNKGISDMELTTYGEVFLTMTAPLLNFDETAMQKVLKNTKSYGNNDIKKALLKVLTSDDYTLMLTMSIKFHLINNTLSHCPERMPALINSLQQPHIMQYNCFGQNKSLIFKAISEWDMVTLNATLSSICGNLNFLDSTVYERFIRELEIHKHLPAIKNCKDDTYHSLYEFMEEEQK